MASYLKFKSVIVTIWFKIASMNLKKHEHVNVMQLFLTELIYNCFDIVRFSPDPFSTFV